MAKEKELDFVVTQDFKTPRVTATGNNKQPTRIDFKYFKKGQILKGVLHKDNQGNPDVLMLNGTMAVPLEVVKRVITKDIQTSGFDGDVSKSDAPTKISLKPKEGSKMKYLDAAIIGGIAGFILTIVSEKKGWLDANEESPYQNKLIGAGVGAVVGAFLIYRFGNNKEEIKAKS